MPKPVVLFGTVQASGLPFVPNASRWLTSMPSTGLILPVPTQLALGLPLPRLETLQMGHEDAFPYAGEPKSGGGGGVGTACPSAFRQILNWPLTVTAPFTHQVERFKSVGLAI